MQRAVRSLRNGRPPLDAIGLAPGCYLLLHARAAPARHGGNTATVGTQSLPPPTRRRRGSDPARPGTMRDTPRPADLSATPPAVCFGVGPVTSRPADREEHGTFRRLAASRSARPDRLMHSLDGIWPGQRGACAFDRRHGRPARQASTEHVGSTRASQRDKPTQRTSTGKPEGASQRDKPARQASATGQRD